MLQKILFQISRSPLSVVLLIGAGAACDPSFFSTDGDESRNNNAATSFEDSELSEQIIADFANVVIVPTYELLATRTITLLSTVKALKDEPTEDNLVAARKAWQEARQPWEQSEGFLFGPVDSNGFDPALDSWPLNRTDLDEVLSGDDTITTDFVSTIDPTLKGFHTAEYLLFGEQSNKAADGLTPRELQYLHSVVKDMSTHTTDLATAWNTAPNGEKYSYAEILADAGSSDNTVYPSRSAAAQEIVFGMIGILDEVANGKIADPFSEQDTALVESQFSFNSLRDFSNNIRSVQNVYAGISPNGDIAQASFSDYVRTQDPDLDQSIRDGIDEAIAAIESIPAPFRDAILDSKSSDEIDDAQEKIREVQQQLEDSVVRLVSN